MMPFWLTAASMPSVIPTTTAKIVAISPELQRNRECASR